MIDEKNIPSAYAEVLAFIDALGGWYRNQIPLDILTSMEKKKRLHQNRKNSLKLSLSRMTRSSKSSSIKN